MTEPLYRRLLGAAYERLPQPLRAMHDVRERMTAHGRAKVERGRGAMIELLAWAFRFPAEGDDVPLTVTFRVEGQREVWERRFAGRQFRSIQEMGSVAGRDLLIERFGPLAFAMSVPIREGRLRLELEKGWCFGVPLPSFLLPGIVAFEHAEGDRFNFHVDLGMPLIGRVVRYRGWLEPVASRLPGREAEDQAL